MYDSYHRGMSPQGQRCQPYLHKRVSYFQFKSIEPRNTYDGAASARLPSLEGVCCRHRRIPLLLNVVPLRDEPDRSVNHIVIHKEAKSGEELRRLPRHK